MKKEIAEKILQETEQGYDAMSVKFSQTRKYFWRGLEFIGDCVKNGDIIFDFGCGNGRLLELIGNKNIQFHGTDVSQGLIDIAKEKYHQGEFLKINPLQIALPFVENKFDVVYSIAVFHHFPSKEYREDVAKELHRITKKDGHIVVTVWNLWQERYIGNIFSNWKDRIFGKNNLDWNDCHISFTDNSGNKFQRFHHAFTKGELKKLFSSVGFEIDRCEIINNRNIILIGRKG